MADLRTPSEVLTKKVEDVENIEEFFAQNLNPQQLGALMLVSKGTPIQVAAKQMNIGDKTLRTLISSPLGRAFLSKLKLELIDRCRSSLYEMLALAVTELRGILQNKKTPQTVKLRAIEILFANTLSTPKSESRLEAESITDFQLLIDMAIENKVKAALNKLKIGHDISDDLDAISTIIE